MKTLVMVMVAMFVACACEPQREDSDRKQQKQQETMLAEATSQTGMPAIKNFRERKLMKQILEMRDQEGLVTYTYLFSEMTGKLTFFCDSIGYGLPYATQFTNPEKVAYHAHQVGVVTLPQADPNGLFSPQGAEGTWVLCKEPESNKVVPVYIEPRTVVSPFKIDVGEK